MIRLEESRFFGSAPDFRELVILTGIGTNPRVTQGRLGEAAGVVTSMVNVRIKEFVRRGLLVKGDGNNRNLTYHLTPEGEARREELARQYVNETVGLYKRCKEEFAAQIEELKTGGTDRVVLYGAGDTGELIAAVAERCGLTIVGVVDSDPHKHGTIFCGRAVQPPHCIPALSPQAIIITSLGHTQEIAESIEALGERGVRIIRLKV